MNWPWKRRVDTSPKWAQHAVLAIPVRDLPDHILTFADCVRRSKPGPVQEQHWQKLYAACRRLETILEVRGAE